MVLIKGNKWTFRRPLEKVSITSYDTSQTTMGGETPAHMHTCTFTHTHTERDRQTPKTYKRTHLH